MQEETVCEARDKNIALLIDSDNVSAKYIKTIFGELSSYGTVSIRRIYGDWHRTLDWTQELLLEYSIQPIQQFSYAKGKNATDIAMVIDAMDILYTGKTDIFCIVSGDSDFTRLAMRLREAQTYVIGMGESKAPISLAKSCNKFVYLDLISSDDTETEKAPNSLHDNKETVTTLEQIHKKILNIISETDDPSISLGELGSWLSKQFTDFDVRNYGYEKLSVMIKEEFTDLTLKQRNNTYYVSANNIADIDTVRNEIIDYIRKNGGTVQNLSQILGYLKTVHKNFSLKDHGFSKISSFLRSVPGITVNGNSVSLKTSKTKKQ